MCVHNENLENKILDEELNDTNGGGSSTWEPVDLICKYRDKLDHCPEPIKKYDNCFGCKYELDE